MPSYLVHHFDPDFDFTHLTPHEDSSGKVDHYNLGYVQNVVHGQIIAERVTLDNAQQAGHDLQFVREGNTFPVGPNTRIDPDNPDHLLADANGYVFYYDGKITVKKLLNVRRDIDFHTGNIVFVSDLRVHGSIRTGFEAHARNILVKGTVEGARIKALGNIVTENGVKGGKQAVLEAKEHMRVPFCENATLKARGNILIDGSCMHTDITVGGNLAIKGRLHGGKVFANNIVYVEDQIGGGISTTTSIIMGYDPFLLRNAMQAADAIARLQVELERLEAICAKDRFYMDEYGPQMELVEKKLNAQHRKRTALWNRLYQSDRSKNCRIVVPGSIRPGVEISMGGAYTKINDFMENVVITVKDREIVFNTPATKQA